jgi:YesN/AraC family two-component response regulator
MEKEQKNNQGFKNEDCLLIIAKEPMLTRLLQQFTAHFKVIVTQSYSFETLDCLKDKLADCIIIALSEKNADQVKSLLYNSKLRYPLIPVIIAVERIEVELIRVVGSMGADKVFANYNSKDLISGVKEFISNYSSKVQLADFGINSEKCPKIIQRALSLIEQHYIDLMSVQEIADYVGVSESVLSKEFKKNELATPKKLLMYFKVRHAVNKMRN